MKATVELQGIRELRQDLLRLALALNPDDVEPILERGANMVADNIRPRIPRKRGVLARALIVKRLKRKNPKFPASSIAAIDRKKAPYAYVVEHGSGERVAKRGKYKGRSFGPMTAQPFMRPGFNAAKRPVLEMIVSELQKLIEKKARR